MKIYDLNEYRAEYPETASIPTMLDDGSLWDAVRRHEKHEARKLKVKRALGVCQAGKLIGVNLCEAPKSLGT